jgi:putative DNA primase/helicase
MTDTLNETPTALSALREAALAWARHGFAVFPLRPHDKIPLTTHGCKDASTDPDQIVQWWRQWPEANIGVATDGLVVVDIDPRHGGDATWTDLLTAYGAIPETLRVITGGGGQHICFAAPAGSPIRNSAGLLGSGIDIRATGGYVVAPPSLHASGRQYAIDPGCGWEPDFPEPPPLAPASAWILDRLTDRGNAARVRVPLPAVVPTGQRHDAASQVLSRLRPLGLQRETLAGIVEVLAAQQFADPADQTAAVVQKLLRDTEEWQRPAPIPYTDVGNAERFVAHHHGGFVYQADRGIWLRWDGTRWAADPDAVIRAAISTVRAIPLESTPDLSPEEQRKLLRHAAASESRQRLDAMLDLARHQEGMALHATDLDADPDLLGVQNGVVDLRTGVLREAAPEDRISQQAGTAYDPDATAPRWLQFLDEVTGHDPETVRFLQKAVGYSLTGHTVEQCLFILHGSGSNGKSTFLTVLGQLLGDYAAVTPAETLMDRRHEAIPNDLAALGGFSFNRKARGAGV